MVNSKKKGSRGELELANLLKTEFGLSAHRTQQFCGDAGDEDVKCDDLPRWFIECKRVQQLNLHEAVTKAKEQAPAGKIPVVIHRKNGQGWLATFELSDAVASELTVIQGANDRFRLEGLEK